MWLIILMLGVIFLILGSTTKQLATSKFGRVGARLLYVLMWACYLGAGIDIARTYNLYAPLLVVCGVLMFYTTIAVLQSDALERHYRVITVFRWAASCFAAGIVLLIAAIINFAAWTMRSGVLFVVAVALVTTACGGDDDTSLWLLLLLIAAVMGLVLWVRNRRGAS